MKRLLFLAMLLTAFTLAGCELEDTIELDDENPTETPQNPDDTDEPDDSEKPDDTEESDEPDEPENPNDSDNTDEPNDSDNTDDEPDEPNDSEAPDDSNNTDEPDTVQGYTEDAFPDPIFRAYVFENFDTDRDGKISQDEALAVYEINTYSDNISSLTGIEYFENLISLTIVPQTSDGIQYVAMGTGDIFNTDIGGGAHDTGSWRDSGCYRDGVRVQGKITSLDLSKNINLQILVCYGNMLTQLDLSNNINLTWVNCSCNLDLSNIILPTSIKHLWLTATSIVDINLSSLTNLELLCLDRGLGISNLDISQNINLSSLNIAKNNIENLNLNNNTNLTTLDCSMSTRLQKLDVSKNTLLSDLSFAFTNLQQIDLSQNVQLKQLLFQNSNISNIDISMLSHLNYIYCGNFRKDTNIIVNSIKNLNVSKNTELEHLFAPLLDLEEIDVTKNTNIKVISVENNNLKTLDISNCLKLEQLYTYNNPYLTTIYATQEQNFYSLIDPHTHFEYVNNSATIVNITYNYTKQKYAIVHRQRVSPSGMAAKF